MFLLPDSISLTKAQINRAVAISQCESIEAQRWQLYLNTLAQIGIENWLKKRAPELQVLIDRSALGSYQLCIGNFRVYLIATDELETDEIAVPRSAIESTFLPHLYVWIEVIEEIGQIQIRNAIEKAKLIEQVQLIEPEGETYWLDATWFDTNPDRLLLWLRCLDANALSTIAPTVARNAIADTLTQCAINVGLWLNDRLDQLAQEFAWILLPVPTPSWELRPMRSAHEEFNQVLNQLTQQGRINTLPQARSGYRDFQVENAALRLYAMTWKATGNSDWTLLLILGAQPGATLPIGTQLQVRDADQILAEPVLLDRAQDYLFAQVIGTTSECFWVSIGFQGTTLTLPPFTFIDDINS